jgi:hypothetical protein
MADSESTSQALTASTADGQDSKAHLFVFTNDKAGMTGVDKEHTNRVIYEVCCFCCSCLTPHCHSLQLLTALLYCHLQMSKGSRYFKHAEKQDGKVDQKMEVIGHTQTVVLQKFVCYNEGSDIAHTLS